MMSNGKTYREVRNFQRPYYIMRFYFISRCYSSYMETVIADLCQPPYPDVIIINSCLWDITRSAGNRTNVVGCLVTELSLCHSTVYHYNGSHYTMVRAVGLPWGLNFNPHTHPIPIPMGIPIPTAALGLPWGLNFNPHTHPIPIPMGIPIPTALDGSPGSSYRSVNWIGLRDLAWFSSVF